jgi:hypothetical protein
LTQTPAAEDPRRATLIADVFADFKRLLAESKRPPSAGDAGLPRCGKAKKPKKEKPKAAAPVEAPFGVNPLKSTGAKDD